MTTNTDYILTPKIIKSILLKEHEKLERFYNNCLSDYCTYAFSLARQQIINLESYSDIEQYMLDSRRMTLKEWIETL